MTILVVITYFLVMYIIAFIYVWGIDHMKENYPDYTGDDLYDDPYDGEEE
jgi:hypothetical protein